jgi:hypothetical protein
MTQLRGDETIVRARSGASITLGGQSMKLEIYDRRKGSQR